MKLLVVSVSAVTLWLTPLSFLDKRIGWHKAIQGLSLCVSMVCAISAGDIARKLAGELEIEMIKERAINADIIDEISTETYISQSQRQQEAEGIIASALPPHSEATTAREALEAQWKQEFQLASASEVPAEIPSDLALWREVEAATSQGKSQTFVIENILKMKGRKFDKGKAKLAGLVLKFGSNF